MWRKANGNTNTLLFGRPFNVSASNKLKINWTVLYQSLRERSYAIYRSVGFFGTGLKRRISRIHIKSDFSPEVFYNDFLPITTITSPEETLTLPSPEHLAIHAAARWLIFRKRMTTFFQQHRRN
ncbi:hypothetical protein K443DRAFT_682109 [Laccaria amethystina LaAM-08-1]|uniref:Unplaced genomic scaffold K443scaffold_178, whole genome shotgun sequence n=1 Tax=Laccaria amethystina LaAM-08-1 TaxID=1095629 RepID=A0A0C9WVX1_9AGAR|nr:hypothetical protein K443DRAFT_682109 [Laccaria amethystina LaAM-08-1]